MQRDHLRWVAFTVAACSLIVAGIGPAAETCRLDDEEYAVYSAVLFPETGGGRQTPVSNPSDLLRPPPELAGIWPGPYTIFSSTMTISAKASDGNDAALLEDFNRKNSQACPIEGDRLRATLPEADRSRIQLTASVDVKPQKVAIAPGFVRLSRVGFNTPKTEAVVEIHAIYSPEAGIGYRAFFQRTSPEVPWRLIDARKTRQF